jgi:hypothetical protein
MEGPMTNDPRNPLPGQQPGTPQNPEQGLGMDPEQQMGSGQQSSQRGSTPTSGASAAGRSSVSGSESERTYQAPQTTRTTTSQTYQTPQPSYQTTPTRTYEAPPRPNNNKKFALFGILGLLALGGIIAGLAASNSSTPRAPVAIRPIVPHHARHVPVSTTGRLVSSVAGTGVRHSSPFTVTGPVTARYSYRCSSGSHPFTTALATSSRSVVPIATSTSAGTSGTVTVHPKVGSKYYLAGSSVCPYHVSAYER